MRFALSLLSLLFVLASSIFLNAQEAQIVPGMENYSNPNHFINDNDTLYFKTYSGIFKFDGIKVDTIVPFLSINAVEYTIFKNRIYYTSKDTLNTSNSNETFLNEISKDGNNTKIVFDTKGDHINRLFHLNGRLIIVSRTQLFSFDGIVATSIFHGNTRFDEYDRLWIYKNKLLFTCGAELYEFDGESIRKLFEGYVHSSHVVFKGDLYFRTNIAQTIMKYDGQVVRKMNVYYPYLEGIRELKVFNNKICFIGFLNPQNADNFTALFEYDGVNNPIRIKDSEGNNLDYTSIEIIYNKKLYLSNYDHVVEYDGVNPPREILGDDYYWVPKFFFDYGDRMIFVPVYTDNGSEPWYMKKDGTIGEIMDISPGPGYSNAEKFFLYKDVLHFNAHNGDGTRLWRYRPCKQSRNDVYVEACAPVLSPSGNEVYDKSGVYSETLSDSYGCDSVVYTHVNIHEIDKTVGFVGNMLISNQSAENYKWLDCNNNYAVVANGTSSKFYVNESGSYAVELTVNGCIDTTECIEINYVGIDDDKVTSSLTVYPNPSQGTVYISSMNAEEIIGVRCVDVAGKNIPVDLQKSGEKYVVTFLNISSGIYFLKCQMKDNRVETVKLFIASER